MIYLSQLTLNPYSRMVRSEVGNPYQLHRTLLKGFGSDRQSSGVLHRLDTLHDNIVVLVQSLVEPDWSALREVGQGEYLLAPPPPPKRFAATFPTGSGFYFRLRANPTVKKKREGREQGNRVPLVREEEQIEWLRRKGEQAGFTVAGVTVSRDEKQTDRIPGGERQNQLTLYTVQFDGLLQVTDTERFAEALRAGIGPAKAFGCGLLSLARA